MSVVFMDGFDLYGGVAANTGVQTRWVLQAQSGGAVSTIAGRFGGQAMRFIPWGAGYYTAHAGLPATYTAMTVGASVRVSTFAAGGVTFLWLGANNATQACLGVGTQGQILAYSNDSGGLNRGGASLLGASANGVIYQNTWHFIEWAVSISGTLGTVTVKVDGATVLTLSGQNTRPQAAAYVDTVRIGASLNGGVSVDVDDLYLLDSATMIGERRIETLRANADTAQKDWTPSSGVTNYTQVDDVTANGDADYVQSTNVGDADLYELSDLSTTPTAIDAVRPVVFAQKTDAATRQLAIRYSSGGTLGDGAAQNLAIGYNAYGPDIYQADPHDSNPWTKARVDALKLGPKVAA